MTLRIRGIILCLLLLLTTALIPQGPAAALTCVDLQSQWPSYALVVSGRVLSWHDPQLVLAADRYYKGDGPPQLTVVATGVGPNSMDERRQPVKRGDHLLLGLQQENGVLYNGLCALWQPFQPPLTPPAELQLLLGEGHPPTAAAAETAPVWGVLGGVLAGVFALTAAVVWSAARRSRRLRR